MTASEKALVAMAISCEKLATNYENINRRMGNLEANVVSEDTIELMIEKKSAKDRRLTLTLLSSSFVLLATNLFAYVKVLING